MYKIAFYLGLRNSKEKIKLKNVENGNPGIGGTQYLFLLTIKHLNRKVTGNYAVLLTDILDEIGDNDIPTQYVGDEVGALDYCKSNLVSVLVINANAIDKIDKNVLNTQIRVFLWAHNTLTYKQQRIAATTSCIERIICVSESQYQNMKDSPCFEKCTYINNVIPALFYDSSIQSNYSEQKAIYIGSVMPQKGVHNLLEIWKYVENVLPKANLFIFGGANVWNIETKLGKDGVADKYYSRIIQHRLSRLKHPENVHFMGVRGWEEINKMILTARVGIVNPSHYLRDETFCMSAIEMEAHGIPVVSRKRQDGLGTSIQNGITGFLEENDKQIANRIVSFLSDKTLCNEMGRSARLYAANFIVDNEIDKWDALVKTEPEFSTMPKRIMVKSKDARLLEHDFLLKIGYLIESGKAFDLVLKLLKHNH